MPTKVDKESQIERFQEAARKLGCDEDEAAFDEKLKLISKQSKQSYNVTKKRDSE